MIKTKQKGFTMIEMIVVIAIFGIMSSVVVFNYTKFRSDTTLVNMAYEVAISLREAQIYGISGKGVDSASLDFSIPYGIYFKEDSNQYFLFADTNLDKEFTGSACTGGDNCISTYTLQKGITVTSIEKNNNNGIPQSCNSSESDMSIVFERPNPEPVIGGNRNNNFAVIELSSSDGISKRYVAIYNNGQISVVNDNPCNRTI